MFVSQSTQTHRQRHSRDSNHSLSQSTHAGDGAGLAKTTVAHARPTALSSARSTSSVQTAALERKGGEVPAR